MGGGGDEAASTTSSPVSRGHDGFLEDAQPRGMVSNTSGPGTWPPADPHHTLPLAVHVGGTQVAGAAPVALPTATATETAAGARDKFAVYNMKATDTGIGKEVSGLLHLGPSDLAPTPCASAAVTTTTTTSSAAGTAAAAVAGTASVYPNTSTAVTSVSPGTLGSVPRTPAEGGSAPLSPREDAKAKNLRRGKWTSEEESYVQQIINDFNNGTLAVAAGTTLRSYLSEKLNCDPMRITKKFTGDSCIGKRVFHPIEQTPLNEPQVQAARENLKRLEECWLAKLDEQKRDAERKSKKGFRHPVTSGELRGMLDGDHAPKGLVQSETLEWLREAQDALKSDVALEVVEELLLDGEVICTKFGIAMDADGGGQTATWASTKRLANGTVTTVNAEHSNQRDATEQFKRRRTVYTSEVSSDRAAGGLLVDFLQTLREQTTP